MLQHVFMREWSHILTFTLPWVHYTPPTRCAGQATWNASTVDFAPKWKKSIIWKSRSDSCSYKMIHTEAQNESMLRLLQLKTSGRLYRLMINHLTKISLTGMLMYTCFLSERTLTWNLKNADGCFHPYLTCQVSMPLTNSIQQVL